MVHDTRAKVIAPSGGEAETQTGPPQDAHDVRGARMPSGARLQHMGVDFAVSRPTIAECPLHTAMRQVAERALTQHVLYAEGVYRPRKRLAHEMEIWLRLHELVRISICPATRTGGTLESGDLEIALAELPVEIRATVATAIRACGQRSSGEGCPLESEPEGRLIGQMH